MRTFSEADRTLVAGVKLGRVHRLLEHGEPLLTVGASNYQKGRYVYCSLSQVLLYME